MTETIKTIVNGVSKQEINSGDIDEEVFTKCLYTYQSPPPDLIIRTSGEIRFSDFLLWQVITNFNYIFSIKNSILFSNYQFFFLKISHSYVYFAKVLWPEFSIWDLLTAVFYYQRSYNDLNESEIKKHNYDQAVCSTRTALYINNLHEERQRLLNYYAAQSTVKS